MKAVLDKAEKGAYDPNEKGHTWPKQPDGVVGATVCSDTGAAPSADPANPGCPTRFEYFLAGTVPAQSNMLNQDIQINNFTGQLAGPTDPPDQVHTENNPTYTDPDGTLYCLNCPIASASATIKYPLPQTSTPPPSLSLFFLPNFCYNSRQMLKAIRHTPRC